MPFSTLTSLHPSVSSKKKEKKEKSAITLVILFIYLVPFFLFCFLFFEVSLSSPLQHAHTVWACLFRRNVSACVAYLYLWGFACCMVDNNSSYYHLQT